MIIPTADFDPLFADDGIPFRDKMLDYIRHEFADVLGKQANLLKSPQGLEVIAQIYALDLRAAKAA